MWLQQRLRQQYLLLIPSDNEQPRGLSAPGYFCAVLLPKLIPFCRCSTGRAGVTLFPDKKLKKFFYYGAARHSAFGAEKSIDNILGLCAAGPLAAAPIKRFNRFIGNQYKAAEKRRMGYARWPCRLPVGEAAETAEQAPAPAAEKALEKDGRTSMRVSPKIRTISRLGWTYWDMAGPSRASRGSRRCDRSWCDRDRHELFLYR